jgi:hypothetical protein
MIRALRVQISSQGTKLGEPSYFLFWSFSSNLFCRKLGIHRTVLVNPPSLSVKEIMLPEAVSRVLYGFFHTQLKRYL